MPVHAGKVIDRPNEQTYSRKRQKADKYRLEIVHSGRPSNDCTCSNALSQFARLAENRCALGLISTLLSRLPAGTTSKPVPASNVGTAEPHTEQNDRTWRVDGRLNVVILSAPDNQLSAAVELNRFAAWAEPVSFWQYLQ